MAKAVAIAEDNAAATEKRGPSIVIQLAVLVVLTAAAAGMGWFSGQFLSDEAPAAEEAAQPGKQAGGGAHGEEADVAPAGVSANVVALEPITTNLAAPSETWARLELALVFDGPPEPAISEAVHQDFLAYMRTVRLQQVEGASGFQHLKSDLEERARLRSDGKVKAILIRTMLFE